jgi:hypothetical protein
LSREELLKSHADDIGDRFTAAGKELRLPEEVRSENDAKGEVRFHATCLLAWAVRSSAWRCGSVA